ncbi:hypothetical protein [Paenibacillus sp. S150]|uniref:hypothetical protein n=1 Tax=Paenibacillus sp. S150 TaxID=2749826 RepID=UPI001C57BBC6|nr:hypothetical protein [Paenibacillus sp. S150]MBW4083499.1 hypothetical protein [Paenibacillus sp. S150]
MRKGLERDHMDKTLLEQIIVIAETGKLSAKGQAAIPIKVREEIGVKELHRENRLPILTWNSGFKKWKLDCKYYSPKDLYAAENNGQNNE